MMTRIRREQGGAVAVMVALMLTALVGMLVLTVDLGGLWNARRKLSTGADAAALAAAQECARGHGSGAASDAAKAIAGENETGAQLVSLTFVPASACDTLAAGANLVTVKLTTSVSMYFAPIFGVNSSPVTAHATATWASPGAAPISVNAAPLEACKAAVEEGATECTLEYDSDQFQEPRWGILVLDLWNQPDVRWCPKSANYTNDIVSGGGIWPLPQPVPAYDCLDSSGNQAVTWQLLEGKTFWFPVVDIPNSYLKNGALVKDDPNCGKKPTCRIVSAYVIDFVRMKVLQVKPGNPEILTVQLVPSLGSSPGIEIRLVD